MVRSGRGPFRPARPRRARAMHDFFFENLRNPARIRRAGLMRQFCPGQLDSRGLDSSCTRVLLQYFVLEYGRVLALHGMAVYSCTYVYAHPYHGEHTGPGGTELLYRYMYSGTKFSIRIRGPYPS